MKPHDLHIGDYNKIVDSYHRESDRAAALLAGSFVEHYLAGFLKEYLVRDAETDNLFEGFGPLSTFSQRIAMAAAMGLIDPDTRRELRAIKEIRNHFAHHPADATFQDEELDKHFQKLRVSTDPMYNASGEGPLKDRKLVYLLTISMIVTSLGQVIYGKRGATATDDATRADNSTQGA